MTSKATSTERREISSRLRFRNFSSASFISSTISFCKGLFLTDLRYAAKIVPCSLSIAGDGRGLLVRVERPLPVLNPFRGLECGAGRPLRQCSSSASVPLSLFAEYRASWLIGRDDASAGFSSSVAWTEWSGEGEDKLGVFNPWAACRISCCGRWYGCGDRVNSRRSGSSEIAFCCADLMGEDERDGIISFEAVIGIRMAQSLLLNWSWGGAFKRFIATWLLATVVWNRFVNGSCSIRIPVLHM